MDHMLEPIKVQVTDSENLITEPIAVIATMILSTNWNQLDNFGDAYAGTCPSVSIPSGVADMEDAILDLMIASR